MSTIYTIILQWKILTKVVLYLRYSFHENGGPSSLDLPLWDPAGLTPHRSIDGLGGVSAVFVKGDFDIGPLVWGDVLLLVEVRLVVTPLRFFWSWRYAVKHGTEQNSFFPPWVGNIYFRTCFLSWHCIHIRWPLMVVLLCPRLVMSPCNQHLLNIYLF